MNHRRRKLEVVGMRILIEGETVQDVGYRSFLLQKAYRSSIKYFDARNVNKHGVEVLLRDEDEKIQKFYNSIKEKKPKGAKVSSIGDPEPYNGEIFSIEKYSSMLTAEELSEGLEELKGIRQELGGLRQDVGNLVGLADNFIKRIKETFK